MGSGNGLRALANVSESIDVAAIEMTDFSSRDCHSLAEEGLSAELSLEIQLEVEGPEAGVDFTLQSVDVSDDGAAAATLTVDLSPGAIE